MSTVERVRLLQSAEIGKVLGDLIGKPVQVKELPALKTPDELYAVASYAHDDGSIAAAFGLDLSVAASLAAALTLVPPGVAADSIRAKALEPMLEENLHEIFNIAGRFFSSPKSPRIVLKWTGKPSDATLKKLWLTAPTRSALELTFAPYKGGKVAFVAH